MHQEARRPPKKARRLKRIGLLLAIASGVGLAVAEVGLRAINAWLHPAIYLLDARLGWRHACDVDRTMHDENGRAVRFVTDARGLRVDGQVGSPGSAKKRVLFAGDSFTEASQVEADEAFASRLAATLDGVQTFNAGVGGYSTVQQLLALPSWINELAPDLVVLVVYENDFADNLMPYFSGLGPRPHMRVADGDVQLVHEPDVARFEPFLQPAPGAFWLYQHCAIYRAVHKNLFLPRYGKELAAREERERGALSEVDRRRAMATLLQRLTKDTEAAGCHLLIAAIPTRAAAQDNAAPSHAWLASRCRDFGTPFVSLLPALHQAPPEAAYFASDIHLTSVGHEHVASALAPAIAAELAR